MDLPFGIAGSGGTQLQVRAVDTDRGQGNRDLDTLHVDRIHVVAQ